MINGLRPGAVVLGILLLATPARGQWRVEVAAGGVSQEALGTAATADHGSAVVGLRHDGRRWISLSAGVPLGSGVQWGAAALGSRESVPLAFIDLGADWSGSGYLYDRTGAGVAGAGLLLEALPFVGVTAGPARLEARTGLAHYTAAAGAESVSRTAHETGVSAELQPARRLRITADAKLVRIDGGSYRHAGAGIDVALQPLRLWAYAGGWTDDVLTDPGWATGADLELGGGFSLRASFQQDATDPLYWNTTRRFWSAGLSRRLGRAPVSVVPVAVRPEMRNGRVIIRIPATSSSGPPSIAGDFNGWTPEPMRSEGDHWVATLRVSPGVYQYAFVSADGEWYVPETIVNRVDDGFGGINAILVVPPGGP